MTRISISSETTAFFADAHDAGARAGKLFLEAVSGEIRRPMNSILAVTELLARQPLSPDALSYVRTIVEHSHSLLRAIEDAKDLVNSEERQLELEIGPGSLTELMDSIQSHWQPRAFQTGVALLVSYDGEDIVAEIDARRVRQVFDNLIEHALRMTRKGGVEVSLKARNTADGVLLEGSVRDSGSGLAPDRLARIFEPRSIDSYGETGIGLALSRRLVEAMNGSIRAESNIGAGSTISFGLVAQQSQPVEPEAPADPRVRAAHVLVVDDNATNRMVAEALCEMFDCTSETAENGVEAVQAAESGRFDLILMDIKMPRMDGVQATRLIRELPAPIGQVPIIALTANADPEDARSYIASGMSCVVEKPIKAEALLAAMNTCLTPQDKGGQAAAA